MNKSNIYKKKIWSHLVKRILYNIVDNLFGNKNYTKIVIITRGRTGSNLLVSLLNSHNQLRIYGEKFNRVNKKSSRKIYKEIFPKKALKKIGFKIFYFHPQDSENDEIWDIINRDKSIKIIHLQRRNLFKAHVSSKIAFKTDKWSNKSKKKIPIDQKRVNLDFKELMEYINSTHNFIKKTNESYKDHPIIEVFYEDLIKDKQDELNRIFDFLEVEPMQVKSSLRKQNTEKISDLVLNFEEI